MVNSDKPDVNSPSIPKKNGIVSKQMENILIWPTLQTKHLKSIPHSLRELKIEFVGSFVNIDTHITLQDGPIRK